MEQRDHFRAWLRFARRLDWSSTQRDRSFVRAFLALQRTVEKSRRTSVRGIGPRAR